MNYLLSRTVSARIYAALTIVALLLSAFPVQFYVAQATSDSPYGSDPQTHVELCHAEGNGSFVMISPNVSGSGSNVNLQGHQSDNGVHVDDVIPPFYWENNASEVQYYEGKNWTTEGQEIWNNDCKVPLTSMSFDLMKKFSGPVPAGYTADQFTFYIDGVDNSIDLTHQTDVEATGAIELDAGTYTLGENGPAGFIPSQWTVQWSGAGCENITDETTTITIDESDLDKTNFGCRADNQWRYGTLNIEKEIVGTEASYDDFSFSVTQGAMTHYDGAFEPDGDNVVLVGAGDYTVTEAAAPGYTTTYSDDCTGTMEQGGTKTCTITNTYNDTPQEPIACDYGFGPDNLLANGSFEDPDINSTWALTAITDWVITKVSDATGIDGELWNGLFGGASEGDQNVELDATEPTQLAQTVTTIPGATYELRFDFSPRPDTGVSDNDVDALVDGSAIMNANGDGNQITENTWTTYSETFIADNASTEIAFADNGSPNGVGSLIDNAVLCLVEEPTQKCEVTLVSDTTDYVVEKDDTAKALSFVHSAWDAVIAGATWIWGDDPVVDPTTVETQTFVKQFGFVGNVTSATLEIASDNAHSAKINNSAAGADADENNFQIATQDSYDVTSLIAQGNNELEIEVTNIAGDANPQSNPAGLLYKLHIEGEVTTDADCAVPYDDEVLGCTDPDALNYNEDATTDDGSCTYSPPLVCDPNVNLIENGDFETPTVTDAAGWDIFTTGISWLVDWIAPNGDATDPASLELHAGVNGWLPSEGNQYAELDGDYEGPGGGSGEPASTKISQKIETIPGEEYTLSWDFSPRPDTDASENNLAVFVDDDQVATNTGVGGAQTEWTADSYTFVASSTETTIAFADDGDPNSEGTFVDNVALVCIPGSGGNGDDDDGNGDDDDDSSSSGSSGGGGGGLVRPVCESFELSESGGIYTLSWETRRGSELAITQDGAEIFSTDDNDEVDEGSILATTNNAEFELTVSRGSRSDTCLIEAESPAGQVLGDQVSIVPLGAAAAGGGGAAPLAPTAGQTIVLLLGQAIRLVRNES